MKKCYCILIAALMFGMISCTDKPLEPDVAEKPVIYLYPDADTCEEADSERTEDELTEKPVIYIEPREDMQVTVTLDYNGTLTSAYPTYNDGWNVLVEHDGTIVDPETGREYYCLFWEGASDVEYDFSEGFCVRGEDTAAFLEESLAALGLNEREANEFIIYWLPRMEYNPYNIISFQTDRYTDNAVLTVEPKPDTMIRVFMAWMPSETYVEMKEQVLTAPEREGFTVVEWGGTEEKD